MGATIALQLYTVRDETARDFKYTLRRVADIGYTAVEFAGYGNLSSQDMAALLADTGLRAIGSHVRLPSLEKDADPISFTHKYLGRIVALHLKDMTPNRTFTELGDGTLDTIGDTKAAQSGGTRLFIVENDSPSIPSLDSARRSFDNMHRSMEWW